MKHAHFHRSRAGGWIAVALLALVGSAHAASPRAKQPDPLRLNYERERAACVAGQTSEPRDVCLREAAAAYAQARQGRLAPAVDGPAQWAANALKRCEAQPQEDREICERRVREGQVSGSVQGGGQLTTLTVRSTDAPKNTGR